MSISATAICLIACHGADHFATFSDELSKKGANVQIYASGAALKRFTEKGIVVYKPFSVDKISSADEDALAIEIAKSCSTASVVLTDVGHPFAAKIHRALSEHAVKVLHYAYYDNPEPFVPGGYSGVAAEVMLASQGILFANSNLANSEIFREPGKAIDLSQHLRFGIGYYPIAQADKIAQLRTSSQVSKRKEIFAKYKLDDKGQKVVVYCGGNNEEYFNKAFPAFLDLLGQAMHQSNFKNIVVVIQQHPAAKAKNIDGKLVVDWIAQNEKKAGSPRVIISDFNSDDAQIIADLVMYYQTSMGPQFVLAGIPTAQIGHEPYEDVLVRNKLCPSITKAAELIAIIEAMEKQHKQQVQREVILKGLGIRADWIQVLEKTLKGEQDLKERAVAAPTSAVQGKVTWPYFAAAGALILLGCAVAYFSKPKAPPKK
jgi:hypothetical protein